MKKLFLLPLVLLMAIGSLSAQSDEDLFGSDDDLFGDDDFLIEEVEDVSAKSDLSKGLLFDNGSVKIGGNFSTSIGTSVIAYADDGKSSFYEWVKSKNLPHKLDNLKYLYNHKSIVLQGEFCGGGIQKNPLKLKNLNWYIFTVDIDGQRATLEMAHEITHKLELDFVPVEETGRHLKSKYPDVESLLKRAEGKYDSGEVKEGIVVRTYDGELSFKAINNEYLLREK